MTALPITSAFVAAFAIALIFLSVPVTFRRIKVNVPIGSADDVVLTRRIRAQGNFIEYVPLCLLALGLVEVAGANRFMILATGGALVVGRALHAWGTLGGSTPLRGIGMLFTYAALLSAAFQLVIASIDFT